MFLKLCSAVLLIIALHHIIGVSSDWQDYEEILKHQPAIISLEYQKPFHRSHNYKNDTQQASRLRRDADDATFRGHEKTREEKWHIHFRTDADAVQRAIAADLSNLLNKVVEKYLRSCVTVVIYDDYSQKTEGIMLETFFKEYKFPFMHGRINQNYTLDNPQLLKVHGTGCQNYILFLSDVLRTRDVIGPQIDSRVIVVPRSSQWKQQEFLSSKLSSDIVNLLVVGESLTLDKEKEHPYVLYTHRLYTDGLGSNLPVVLTTWIKGGLSRPKVNLFPTKLLKGFAGHRFIVSAIHKPPYVIKTMVTDRGGNIDIQWDGLEFRILRLLGKRLNFTYEIVEPPALLNELGPTFGVINDVVARRADFGLGGAYITIDRLAEIDMSAQHSKDCAAFITLTSKALPRYRAIMGPFQWPVWVAIIATYMLAIFPLAFSDQLTLRHLIGNWSEIENMFWYVFGTFTNSLTFSGKFSWSTTKRSSTRLLIGFYWMFTIIITACYTSSIIAFVTLPVFPETVDSISDLLGGFYRIGTLFNDGWQSWFLNSTDAPTQKLLKNLEFVANVEEGLNNVTKAFFWPYAFLSSRTQLEYIADGNFSNEQLGRTTALHISEECLSIFGVAIIIPKNSVFKERLNSAILRLHQSGMIEKLFKELQLDIQISRGKSSSALLRSKTPKQLSASDIEDRGLTLADTEGMFLLMGIGYLFGVFVLVSEIVGGFTNKCRKLARRVSIATVDSVLPNSSRKTSMHSNWIGMNGVDSGLEAADHIDDHRSLKSSTSTTSSMPATRPNGKRRLSMLDSRQMEEHWNNGGDGNAKLRHRSSVDLNRFKGIPFVPSMYVGSNPPINVTTAEINRVPTPFIDIDLDLDESFGERVLHSSHLNVSKVRNFYV